MEKWLKILSYSRAGHWRTSTDENDGQRLSNGKRQGPMEVGEILNKTPKKTAWNGWSNRTKVLQNPPSIHPSRDCKKRDCKNHVVHITRACPIPFEYYASSPTSFFSNGIFPLPHWERTISESCRLLSTCLFRQNTKIPRSNHPGSLKARHLNSLPLFPFPLKRRWVLRQRGLSHGAVFSFLPGHIFFLLHNFPFALAYAVTYQVSCG